MLIDTLSLDEDGQLDYKDFFADFEIIDTDIYTHGEDFDSMEM